MLFAGARFLPLEPGRPAAEALLVRDGRVVALGPYAELRAQAPGEPVQDLGGGVALPGLSDAHGHLLLLGAASDQLDLRGLAREEVIRRVAEAPRRGGWVRGRAWADASWTAPPDAADLEPAARGDLVFLERADAHAAWVSQAVLRAAGIGRETPDPPGGRIERRPDGTPTGVLVDRAMEAVERLLPAASAQDLERQLALAAARCADVGLVGVHEAGLDGPALAALRRLEAAGALPLRVYAMQREAASDADDVLEAGPQPFAPGGRVALRGVKLFLDGALGSRGAAFFEPYADADTTGLLLEELEALSRKLARRMGQGYQVALHAIGDRANALALEAIERAQALCGRRDLRPRVEHAQHVRPADLARFRAAGAIASMQPIHQASDWPWARARLGPARYPGAYAWRSMLRAGVALAFGSDFPIEDPNPLLGVQAAVSRAPEPGAPDERLTAAEALRAFTRGAAWAAFEEREAGALEPGLRADFTLLDRDPLACPPGELGAARALATCVGGALRPTAG